MQRVTKKLIPFAYLSPTMLLLAVLSLIPIVTVFYYSLMNNVIMEKNPVFVGIANYVEILTDKVFQQAFFNTMYFTVMSVIFHLILGLSFALLLNTKLLGPTTKAIFRVVYILPWVFTADDHRDAVAADAEPQRRHQLYSEHAQASPMARSNG